MKIKSLAGLINKSKKLVLLDIENSGTQWAGDGVALYSLSGLPKMNCMECFRMMDIPEAKSADIDTRAQIMPDKWAPYTLPLDDTQGLQEILPTDEIFSYKGYALHPFSTRDGATYLIQTKYLKPLENADGLSFWLAKPGSFRFVVAYDGLFPAALLPPLFDTQGNIASYLSALATKLKYTSPWSNEPEEREETT